MGTSLINRYLNLLTSTLLDDIYGSHVAGEQHWNEGRAGNLASTLEVDEGQYWPERAHTMIGRKRLLNLRTVIERVIADEIPGDLIETGVWRGGASIFIKGVLAAHGIEDRKVFVADSFAGLPPPDPRYPADSGDTHTDINYLRVSKATVAENFKRYDLLDESVVFLEGFFEDTLPNAPIEKLSVLRLDGDMYSSTVQALESLYDKVSPGGFVVVDDYALPGCQQAIDEFRATRDIDAPLNKVDWTGVWWRLPR